MIRIFIDKSRDPGVTSSAERYEKYGAITLGFFTLTQDVATLSASVAAFAQQPLKRTTFSVAR